MNALNKNVFEYTLFLMATVIVAKISEPGITRRALILRARNRLAAEAGISHARAEALVWQAVAEAECREVSGNHFINAQESTRELLVINAPGRKLVFTLRELVHLHEALSANGGRHEIPMTPVTIH